MAKLNPTGTPTDSPRLGSPLDDKLDVTPGSQDLAQLGGSEAVGPSQGDSLGQPADVQIFWVHLEARVGHLGWFRESQCFS